MALFDELASGVPSVSAPAIEHALVSSHAMIAAALFVAPGIAAMVIEPFVFLLADRYPRAWFVRGGLVAMAASSIVAGLAPNAIVLSGALAVLWIAIGSASSLAQATLVDRAGDERGRVMARWTLLSLIGDLLAPALVAVLAVLGLGWRASFLTVGALLAAWAVIAFATPFTSAPPHAQPSDASDTVVDEEPSAGLLANLRDALRDRVLIAWLFGLALCDLLDEILVVFATIHVRVELGGGPMWQSAVVASSVGGGAIGLFALDRLLKRRTETQLLIAFGIACAISFVAWLAAPTPWLSTLLSIAVGATSTPLYPLVAAQAFARRPEHSGSVLAAGHLFTPLALALPWSIGLVADHAGTYVALALLVAQPIGLVLLALLVRRQRR
jgi:MFS family permease